MLRTTLIFTAFSSVLSAVPNISWTGCGPFENEDERLSVGESTVVCMHVANDLNWVNNVNYLRLSFQPRADEYSRFHVPNSYNDLLNGGDSSLFSSKNITVSVASQQRVSFPRLYYDAETRDIYPHLTAIIDVSSGQVNGVTWDDACVFCGGNKCLPVTYNFEGQLQTSSQAGQAVGGCPVSLDECGNNPAACDLTLYVVWTGSDSDGQTFQSSANRFSAFPRQNIQDRFTANLPSGVNNNRRDL